jgi:hypothetical protein
VVDAELIPLEHEQGSIPWRRIAAFLTEFTIYFWDIKNWNAMNKMKEFVATHKNIPYTQWGYAGLVWSK